MFSFLRGLIDIPSVTGSEEALGEHLEADLQRRGYRVERQSVTPQRFNLLARGGSEPRVVLCTHLDTVPPFVASREDGEYIYGRGACDAKGSLVAMVTAADQLRSQGCEEIGLLFVVGEETDSVGAKRANDLDIHPEYIVVGEPTENRMASAHKGSFAFRLEAAGIEAHSASPDQGASAVHRLLDALERIRSTDWGLDDDLGPATVNVGILTGGVAGNVLAPRAEAQVFVRVVGSSSDTRRQLDTVVASLDHISYDVLVQNDAVRCTTLPGFETSVVPFGTDIPYLTRLGQPLLMGPGRIHDAHAEEERVAKTQLETAVEHYARAATMLLER